LEIKLRLLKINKKQVDLIAELRLRGFPTLRDTQLSHYVNHMPPTAHCGAVMAEAEKILKEWEDQKFNKPAEGT